jgi:hypothetical protein
MWVFRGIDVGLIGTWCIWCILGRFKVYMHMIHVYYDTVILFYYAYGFRWVYNVGLYGFYRDIVGLYGFYMGFYGVLYAFK